MLSGLIGALLAKGVEPFAAAALGALAHARAGRAAAERHGADHVIAGDVIDALPAGVRAQPAPIRSRAMASTVGEIMEHDPETVSRGRRRRRA